MALKVLTVVGTRPEIIKLSRVIPELDLHTRHVFVHTGQNYDYELNEIFFRELGIRSPDLFLDAAGGTPAQTVGQVIAKADEVFAAEKPDALLILGDTNSCLAAYPAKRRKIPIFHMEAGNRCFDQSVPEEINRKVVDHLSDINLPYTENSRLYLISEGQNKDTVFVTGSPMFEVLQANLQNIERSDALSLENVKAGEYFVVSMHREENLDIEEKMTSLVLALNSVAERFSLPLIFSTHPRTLKKIEEKGLKFDPLIRVRPPFGFFDYCKLQMNAKCVLSDSGTIPEESAMLNFPAVSIRTSMERPEALEGGTIVLGGIDSRSILGSIDIAVRTFDPDRMLQIDDYRAPNVSEKVLKLVQGYTSVVNHRVWNKR